MAKINSRKASSLFRTEKQREIVFRVSASYIKSRKGKNTVLEVSLFSFF